MDTKTGDIFEMAAMEKMRDKLISAGLPLSHFIKMKLPPTPTQLHRKPVSTVAIGRVGRNEPCPCNSGKKFKKCCLTT